MRRARGLAIATTIVVSIANAARADDEALAPLPSLPPAAPAPAEAPVAPLPPPTQETPRETKRSKKSVGLTGRIHGGYGQRRLYDDSAVGADVTGGIGAYVDNVDLYIDVQLLFASSDSLPVRQYLIGPSVDFEAFSRARLGAGLSLGGTSISRETSGDKLTAFSVGARAFASVDVLKLDEHAAVYILGQLSVESAGPLLARESRTRSVSATTLWGPTIAVGARF